MENDTKAVDTGEPKYARGSPGFPSPDVGYTHTVQPRQNGDPLLIYNTQDGEGGETKTIWSVQWRGNAWTRSVVAVDQGLLDMEPVGPNAFRVYLAARETPGRPIPRTRAANGNPRPLSRPLPRYKEPSSSTTTPTPFGC